MKNNKEITREEYGHYLKLPYEIFAKALHMSGFWSEGSYDYSYCTSKDNDNDEARDKIVDLMGDLPKIELFAWQQFDGWDCWGNEV